LLDAAAVATGIALVGLRNAFDQIAHDPYTAFIAEAWPEEEPQKPQGPVADQGGDGEIEASLLVVEAKYP
jgi:hypothetical protein